MIEVIKRQNLKKILIICFNLVRMIFLKILHMGNLHVALLQNIHPTTEIVLKSHGTLNLKHSIFTRRYVSFRVEGGNMTIGTCFFNQGCSVTCLDEINIGDGCLFGPNVVIVDHDHDYLYKGALRGSKYITEKISIGNNVVIGANSVILKGTKIGDNCIIGAGSIVKGKIEADSMFMNERTIREKKIEFHS